MRGKLVSEVMKTIDEKKSKIKKSKVVIIVVSEEREEFKNINNKVFSSFRASIPGCLQS